MTKPRALIPRSSSSASASELGISRSQAIAKLKPKIRVIHIDAPTIIKTDAANFRDLVQRLTGKPGDSDDQKTPPTSKDLIMEKIDDEEEEDDFLGLLNGKKKIKNEYEEEDDDEIPKRRSKSNKEMRLSSFFDHHGFSELDGSMEQLGTMN